MHHERVDHEKRTFGRWLRDDLTRPDGPRGAAARFRFIAAHPRTLLLGGLYLAVAVGLYVLVLLVLGRLDRFGEWLILPGLVAAGLFGRAVADAMGHSTSGSDVSGGD
jgi:hypothetical protein